MYSSGTLYSNKFCTGFIVGSNMLKEVYPSVVLLRAS